MVPKARAEDAIRSRAREDVFLSFEEDVSVEIWRERMAIAREFQKKKMFLLRSSTHCTHLPRFDALHIQMRLIFQTTSKIE